MTPDSEMEQLTPTGQRQMALKEGADFERDVDDFESAGFSLAEERTLLKKLDRRVVLLISGLYLLSFLDRSSGLPHHDSQIVVLIKPSDIGNAKIAGLLKDLKLTDNQYEWLLTAFYAMYISFQWMTLLLAQARTMNSILHKTNGFQVQTSQTTHLFISGCPFLGHHSESTGLDNFVLAHSDSSHSARHQ